MAITATAGDEPAPGAPRGQLALLRTRRFAPFFWTQLLGALNDNLYKNALVILFAFGAAQAALSTDTLVNLAGGVFVLPFFLFSATAGQLADRWEKSRLVRAVKVLEIAVMALAAVGLHLRSVTVLLVALFLMGFHSALFGPVKYSILPQLLRDEELVGGNALVEMATFVAILAGTILGGVLVAVPSWGPTLVSVAVLGLAVAGWLASRGVPAAPAVAPDLRIRWNPVTETWRAIGFARADRSVWVATLAISWFWFYGALFLAQFPGLGHAVLGGDEHVVTLLLAVFSIGIGAGCLLCGSVSRGRIEPGLVPIGAIGLSLFAFDLAFAAHAAAGGASVGVAGFLRGPAYWRVAADLVLIGAFGGLFIVPLLALVQQRSEVGHRSRIIAAGNVVSSGFMVVAAAAGIGLRAAGVGIPEIFLLAAAANAAVAAWACRAMPELATRFALLLRAPAGRRHLARPGRRR
jgi:MFS family permease